MATGGVPQQDCLQIFILGRRPYFNPNCRISKADYKQCFELLRRLHTVVNQMRNYITTNDPREEGSVSELRNDAVELYLQICETAQSTGPASRHLSPARRQMFGNVALTIRSEVQKLYYTNPQERLARSRAMNVLQIVQELVEYLAENLPRVDDGTAPTPSANLLRYIDPRQNIAEDSHSDTTDSGAPTPSRSFMDTVTDKVRKSFRLKKKSRAISNMQTAMSELEEQLSGTVLNTSSSLSEESNTAPTPIDLDGMRTERRRQRMQHPSIQPRSVTTPGNAQPGNAQSISISGSDGSPLTPALPPSSRHQGDLPPAYDAIPPPNYVSPDDDRPPSYSPSFAERYPPSMSTPPPRLRMQPSANTGMHRSQRTLNFEHAGHSPSGSSLGSDIAEENSIAPTPGSRNNLWREGSRVRLLSDRYPPYRTGDLGIVVSDTPDGRVLVRLDYSDFLLLDSQSAHDPTIPVFPGDIEFLD